MVLLLRDDEEESLLFAFRWWDEEERFDLRKDVDAAWLWSSWSPFELLVFSMLIESFFDNRWVVLLLLHRMQATSPLCHDCFSSWDLALNVNCLVWLSFSWLLSTRVNVLLLFPAPRSERDLAPDLVRARCSFFGIGELVFISGKVSLFQVALLS